MNKCTCYCTGGIIRYDHMGFKTYTESYGYCNGTKEREECFCGGDLTKCEFYPEVRERVLKEQKPKFGEWISIKDRLPEKFIDVLCLYPNKNYGSNIEIDYMESDRGYFAHQFKYGELTHWMPLPEPPKGD